jgi:hypothetical protein
MFLEEEEEELKREPMKGSGMEARRRRRRGKCCVARRGEKCVRRVVLLKMESDLMRVEKDALMPLFMLRSWRGSAENDLNYFVWRW